MQHHLKDLLFKDGVYMEPGKRFGLSAIEKRDVWRRWKVGETLHEIGRAFDKPHTSTRPIRCLLLPRGGIPPAVRRRSRLALTRSEREDISRGMSIRSRHRYRTQSVIVMEISAAHQKWGAPLSPGHPSTHMTVPSDRTIVPCPTL
jgi:hypothetical protein